MHRNYQRPDVSLKNANLNKSADDRNVCIDRIYRFDEHMYEHMSPRRTDVWAAKRQLKHNKRTLLHQETEGSDRGSPVDFLLIPLIPMRECVPPSDIIVKPLLYQSCTSLVLIPVRNTF